MARGWEGRTRSEGGHAGLHFEIVVVAGVLLCLMVVIVPMRLSFGGDIQHRRPVVSSIAISIPMSLMLLLVMLVMSVAMMCILSSLRSAVKRRR